MTSPFSASGYPSRPFGASSSAPQGASPAPLPPQRIWAVVPCGGSGSRAGGDVPKQYRMLAGLPVLAHTLVALAQVPHVAGVVLAIAEQDAWFDVIRPGPLEGGFATLPQVAERNGALAAAGQVGVAASWLHVRRCAGDSRAQTVLNGLRAWVRELKA